MIVLCAGINKINNELRRTQNELTLLEHFALFASFAVPDFFHRKERKDSLIGFYTINHRGLREHREKWQSSAIPVTTYEKATASRFRTRMTRMTRFFTDILDQFASAFHRRLSAFICVHLRLIYVSLSDRTRKIQFELFTIMKKLPIISCFLKQNIIKSALRGEI
jgi:hypothetical protein